MADARRLHIDVSSLRESLAASSKNSILKEFRA